MPEATTETKPAGIFDDPLKLVAIVVAVPHLGGAMPKNHFETLRPFRVGDGARLRSPGALRDPELMAATAARLIHFAISF